MNRLKPDDFETRGPAVSLGDGCDRPAGRVAGLLFACSAECFAPECLALELNPGHWLVHRTPGNVVPPFGAGCPAEEELVERAVNDLRIDSVVVCGHHPCGVTSHLLPDAEPVDDFLLREWLSHAEAVRRIAQGLRGEGRARAAAEHNVLVQVANLRTHPAVAAAIAGGRLKLWAWLHAGELLCPGRGAAFDRPVALDPEQNRHLRRERVLQCRRPSPTPVVTPYLA